MSEQVYENNRIYTIVKDLQSSYQVLVTGVVIDELTNEAPAGALTVSIKATNVVTADVAMMALVFIKVLDGGLFCLAGEPGRIFPDLSTADQALDLQIHVPGYQDVKLPVIILKDSAFPVPAIPPVNKQSQPPPIKMQRQPVRIQGRVIGMTANPAPIVGARVRFVDEPNPPSPLTEHAIALRSPLYFSHAVGNGTTVTKVNQRQLAPDPAVTAKQLVASAPLVSAPLVSQTLTLNDLTGLAANDVLLVGSEAAGEAGEYVMIDSLPPGATGQVLLHNKLKHSFAVGTAVQKFLPGAIGTSTTLARPAQADEGVLFLLNNLPMDPIEIADATAALVEYHALGAITGDNGYYRLDGITRVRTLYLDASAAGFTAMREPVAWTIDYGQPVNNVDIRLVPLPKP